MTTSEASPSHALVEGFLKLYPQEGAEALENFSIGEILEVLTVVPVTYAADVLIRLNGALASEALQEMDDRTFSDILPLLDPSRAAAILARLAPEVCSERLGLLPQEAAREIREIMSYPTDRAGYLMDTRVASFRPGDTVEAVFARIRSIRDRRIHDVHIVDEENRLTSVLPLQQVAVFMPTDRLETMIAGEPLVVNAMASREEVCELLESYSLASLPVVDTEGRLLGVIRHDALVSATQLQATSSIQTMVGAGKEERALSKVSFAVKMRLPWLEINLVTAFLAAAVVGIFEGTIAKFTALAILLPVVAGQSGNTGAQALAVTMRGLALREVRVRQWLRILTKEASVGFLNGVAVSVTTAGAVFLWSWSIGLALVIGVSMVISMVIAGIAGAGVPLLLTAFGQDPAQSSSIILTTVTDVVGFFSFLGLATILSGMLVAG